MFLDANKKCTPCVHRGLLDAAPFSPSCLCVSESVISHRPADCRLPLCAVVLLVLIFGSSPMVHTS